MTGSPPQSQTWRWLITAAAVVAATVSPSRPAADACGPEADGSPRELSASWDALHDHYRRYGHCGDDGDVAEGYSEAVLTLLGERWQLLPRLSELLRRDPGFRAFVMKHVDGQMDRAPLVKIREKATNACPRTEAALCAEIAARAKAELDAIADAVRPKRVRANGETILKDSIGSWTITVVIRTRELPTEDVLAGRDPWGYGPTVSVVRDLAIVVGKRTLFVPRSCFADLLNVNTADIESRRGRLLLLLVGGDASTSYEATIELDGERVTGRWVTAREDSDHRLEETTFPPPHALEDVP